MTTAPLRRTGDPRSLLEAARGGDRGSLARLISIVERGGPPARRVGELAFASMTGAYTVGMTGAPGAGKSTLADRLVALARQDGVPRLAVLAIDPSSPFSGGAILGDRVRMQDHVLDPGVFIRSMATRGHFGGLALAVPEAMRVLDAAGIPLVIVETVGVGQVEVDVAGATDTTVVVVTPGWGDSVQASKAGLLETADVFVVNKADRDGTREAVLELRRMLELSRHEDWQPPIVSTVASSGEGVDELWAQVGAHRAHLEGSGLLAERRAARLEAELRDVLVRMLDERTRELADGADWASARRAVLDGRSDPYGAASEVLESLGVTAPPSGAPGRAR